ncbi:hypothetical protein ACIBCT_03935 [Streptosporangium sp. NPDC050855]|uniref:hypothetical protein n=1 Tax=Streptosporangium sp. NPDC050855 TaxID=3366194 RepID=UPI0037A2828F
MNTPLAAVTQIAVPFLWLGMVLAISFLEAPLKFRAPGITVPLGLGIGRLVFRALNVAELVLAVVLTLTLLLGAGGLALGDVATTVLIALWVLLVVQVTVLRPRLDRRARQIIEGGNPPRSHHHLLYIAAECLKVVLLVTLGVLLASRLLS